MNILHKIRAIAVVSAVFAISTSQAAEKPPKVLGDYLKVDENVKGEVVVVIPPKEFQDYADKIKEASKKDFEWFKQFSEKAKPGVPLPYDEKLGLTQKEHQKYLELWGKREFKAIQQVGLRLEEADGGWRIKGTGAATRLSLLRYDSKRDVIVSTNGELGRIEDIDAASETILKAWKGHEWKFEEETGLGKTKENFAIGKTGDGKFNLIVYRLQDISKEGRPLFDQSMVIRFARTAGK